MSDHEQQESQEQQGEASPPDESPTAKLEQQVGELTARLQRTMADFQNAQKRHQRELQEAGQLAVGEFIKLALPVIDNLERALETPVKSEEGKHVLAGVRIVLDQFLSALKSRKVTAIDEVGGMFDPHLHEALMQQHSDHEPMTVLNVAQRGYQMAGQTLRPAKVVVSRGPAAAPSNESPA